MTLPLPATAVFWASDAFLLTHIQSRSESSLITYPGVGRISGTVGQILVFPSPTGYMLTSFSFPLLKWGFIL